MNSSEKCNFTSLLYLFTCKIAENSSIFVEIILQLDSNIMKLNGAIIHLLNAKAKIDVTTKAGCDYLRNDIEAKTGEALSLNTVKRLVGILNYDSSPREITLDIIARYLGFANHIQMQMAVQDKISEFNTPTEFIDLSVLPEGARILIKWNPDRTLRLRHLAYGSYLVEESSNSKLTAGDILELSQIALGFPFMVKNVTRSGRILGNYTAAKTEGLSSIEVING